MLSTCSPRWLVILALITALGLTAASPLPAAEFDVRAYGATGDGRTLDTAAINRAIDAAAAAGGGTVVFPAGTYASYSIHLRSHVALMLGPGSTLLAAEPSADLTAGYDAPEPNPVVDRYEDFGHSHWHNSLIWGEDLVDIAITGPGRIYGLGLSRGTEMARRDLLTAERRAGAKPDLAWPAPIRAAIAAAPKGPFGYPGEDTLPAGMGNKAIALKRCRNVIFRDFTIEHGGHFGILATAVDNWTVDNLKIDTNRDGIDFDCCQNVRVANCTVNSPYDDGICPKSSFGLGYARITENVTIVNCQVSGYDEGTLLDGTRQRTMPSFEYGGPTGRIKCGTESNGGFRNLTIANCVFEYCRGLALESVDGALMEDITVTNLTMRDVMNAPIYIRLGARLRGPAGTKVGTARRITIANVVAHGVAADSGILIMGLPDHPIEDLTLSHILVDYVGGGSAADAARAVPEQPDDYPEPWRHGIIPAWGLWARHVRNLSVDHVDLRTARPDLRAAVMLEDAREARFGACRLPPGGAAPAFVLRRVAGFALQGSPGFADVQRPDSADERLAAPAVPIYR